MDTRIGLFSYMLTLKKALAGIYKKQLLIFSTNPRVTH